jgi:flagellin
VLAGTTLEQDMVTSGDQYLTKDMVLAKDSVLLTGSIVAANGGGSLAGADLSDGKVYRLFEVDVTTQESAQIAISIADAALAQYDGLRAGLGSTQNQLTSTIANLSVTMVNVSSAESAIRDVDFAEEAQNFSKMQILAQTGAYAMSQANASSQIVMSLLQ